MKNSRLIPYILMVCMVVFSGCSVLNTFTSNSGVQNMQTEKYMHDFNWVTYTNQSKGLTFRYPKQILNLYNYFCLPIPTTIIDDGDWLYVAPEKIFSPDKGCNDTTLITKENVKQYALLAIATGDAHNQAEVETFLQRIFQNPQCTVRSMSVFRDGPQQLVVRGSGCDKIPDEITILFHPHLEKVLVYPQQPSQAVFTTIDPQKKGFVKKNPDAEVWGSIGFVQ